MKKLIALVLLLMLFNASAFAGSGPVTLSPAVVNCVGLTNIECEEKLHIDFQWAAPAGTRIEVWALYVTHQAGKTFKKEGLSAAEQKAIQPELDKFLQNAVNSEIYCQKKYAQCNTTALSPKLSRMLFTGSSGVGHFGVKTAHGKLPVMVVAYGAKFPQSPKDYVLYPTTLDVTWGPKPWHAKPAPIRLPAQRAVFIPGACPPATPLTMEEMSYEQVKAFLEKNPSVNTVDGLVSCLPDAMFDGYYSAIHTSVSPEAKDIDSDHPRILLVTPDGRFAISFTGLPTGEDYETVRFLEYSEQEKRFHLYKIAMDETTPTFEADPQSCAGCHSATGKTADIQPIWNGYRGWHNAFGSHSDGEWNASDKSYYNDMEQYEQYKQFLLKKMKTPRYKRFIAHVMQATQVTPEFLASAAVDVAKPEPPANQEIGAVWGKLNGMRIAEKLAQSPEFSAMRFRFMANLLGCEMSPQWKQQFQATYASVPSVKEYYDYYLQYADPKNWPDSLYDRYHDSRRYAVIGVLSGAMGIPYADWDMAAFPDPEDGGDQAFDARGPALFFGLVNQDSYVFAELFSQYSDVSTVADSLKNLFGTEAYYSLRLDRESRVVNGGPAEFTAQCNALAPYVEQELGK